MTGPALRKERLRRRTFAFFVGIVGLQILVMLCIHLISLAVGQGGLYPIVLGGDDGRIHYAVARYMVATGDVGVQFAFFDVSIWPSILARVMMLTRTDNILVLKQLLLIGRVLDIVAGLVLFEALLKANRVILDEWRIARGRVVVLAFVGLFPSAVIYSFGSLYRDSIIYGLHLMGVALILQTIYDRRFYVKLLFGILAALDVYVLSQFRAYASMAICVGVGCWALALALSYVFSKRRYKKGFRKAIVTACLTIVLTSAAVASWNTAPVQALIFFRESYFTLEGSNLRISFVGKNPIQAAPLYLYSVLSNIIGPLPWQIRAASNAISFLVEVPILMFVAWSIWVRRALLNPACTFLIAQAFAWFAMIGFTNDNLGTAGRLRVLGWQCLFLVFAYVTMLRWFAPLRSRKDPVLLESAY